MDLIKRGRWLVAITATLAVTHQVMGRVQEVKLVASDATAFDYFGKSVSLSGDRVLVGAHQDDAGAAYVYEFSGGSWVETAKLTASDAAANDYFGFAVSLVGDRALVGARYDDDGGFNSGSAYIYEYDGANWIEAAKLIAGDAAADDNFGYSVSLSGNRALVGAYREDGIGPESGSAYVFEYDGANWVEMAKLTAGDAAAGDLFGISVSLSGDRALVGAHHDEAGIGAEAGSAYVFEYDGANWNQAAKLTAGDGAAVDQFGASVSLSGDRALVGSQGDDAAGSSSGSAYVYEYDGVNWIEAAKLTAGDAAAGDLFGIAVSLLGARALVGAYHDDDGGSDSGSAYVYEYDGANWVEISKLVAGDVAAGDEFGIAVALADERALVGSHDDDDAGSTSGSAYVFALPSANPIFTDVAYAAGVDVGGSTAGGAWGDYDDDGDLDLFVANYGFENLLYENDGAGAFADVAPAKGLDDNGRAVGVAWGDYDSDGDLDLIVTNGSLGANKLYRNEGTATFSEVAGTAGVLDHTTDQTAAWGDYDNDGDLDLYLGLHAGTDRLLRNNGAGIYSDVAGTAMVPVNSANGHGLAWGDYDDDGDIDLFVTNLSPDANVFYQNDGSGTLVEVGSGTNLADTGESYGGAWADYDNDGDLDLYMSNGVVGTNRLYRNNGDTTFDNVESTAGVDDMANGKGVTWGDYDGDGNVDLYVTNPPDPVNGFAPDNRLYHNNGDGTFADRAFTEGVADGAGDNWGALWGDYDNDGDLDLYVLNTNGGANRLFRNNTDGATQWLQVELTGTVSNRSGIGTQVFVTTGATTQRRDVSGGSGLFTQNSLPVEFGFGSTTVVDQLTVKWPSGTVQTLSNVASNQVLPLTEPIVINIDPVAYIGTYNVAGQGYVSGPSTATLTAGTYSFTNGTASFQFTVAANGDVTSLNPDAATGNGNTLTLNNIAFNVDPVNYTGAYDAISGAPFVIGPQTFIAIPTLTSRVFNGNSSFQFTVDASGNITHSNPDAATVSGNTITFNNVAYNVDPVNYIGLYTAIPGGAFVTGPQSLIAIPTFTTRIANGTSSFTFNVAVNGDVTSLNPDAATSNGNTLIFNNTNVEVDPTTYAGLYTVTGFNNYFSGVSTIMLVPDLTVRLTADSESDTFTADANQVTPPSFDLTISGQPHTFNFSLKNDQEVVIPNVTATYNELVSIPVTISGTGSTPIVSAEVFICYDGDLLAPVGTDLTGTLAASGWSIQSNIEEGGQIDTYKIAMATDDDAITGPGTLINITFQVADVRVPSSSALVLKHVLFNDGDPGNVATDGSLTLIVNTGTISSLPTQIVPRETITITVVDADADLNGTPGDNTVDVLVTNTNNSDFVNLTLNEDGAIAGTFSGTIDTEYGTALIVDLLIQAKATDTIVSTYADALDAAGNGPINRTAQTNVIGGADGSVEITLVSQPGDPLYIEVTDADLNTSISSGQTVAVTVENTTTNDIFIVVLAEADDNDEVFFGSLPTTAGASTGTELSTTEDDIVTATYDDVVTLVGDQQDRTAINDVIFPWGDADDNDVLQAFDAAKILVHVLNGTPIDELAANVDDETVTSGINPFDASLVLQKRVGLIATFPVQDPTAENHPQGDPASPKLLPEQRQLALVLGDGYIGVYADERGDLLAGDLTIKGINGRVEMGADLANYLTAFHATDGGLRIVFAGAEAAIGPGELLRVYGVGPTTAHLVRATFNNGDIEGTASGLTIQATPATFALYPNMPNPFNPETTLRFELPHAAEVKLEVFDILGQKVRTLVASPLQAGTHTAIWHGRNDDGVQVGNGVYLYRLQTDEFSKMRRMLLLK